MTAAAVAQPIGQRVEQGVVRWLAPAMAAALLALLLLPDDVARVVTVQAFVAILASLVAVDLLTMRVPNASVYPAIAFALAATAVVDASVLPDALTGGAVALAVMFVLALLGRGQMGMGDVKFACLVGCFLGVRAGLMALALGFVAGGAVAALLLLLRLKARSDAVPMTPFLAGGAFAYAAVAGTLLS